jgi:hypothetical protein
LREKGEYPTFEEAVAASASGETLDYRRGPQEEWRACGSGHEMNAHFYYRRSPQPALTVAIAPQAERAPWIAPAPLPSSAIVSAKGTATLRLGQINERLAPITLTAEGLAMLGFKHATTEKSAKLYFESDFEGICGALIRHIEKAAAELERAA